MSGASGNRTMTMYGIAARSSLPTMNVSYRQVEGNAVTHPQQSAINLIKHRCMTSATCQDRSDVVGLDMNPPDRTVALGPVQWDLGLDGGNFDRIEIGRSTGTAPTTSSNDFRFRQPGSSIVAPPRAKLSLPWAGLPGVIEPRRPKTGPQGSRRRFLLAAAHLLPAAVVQPVLSRR